MEKLPHTKAVKRLLAQGDSDEAVRLHNARVKSEFEKAKEGEIINLSDLLAAKETLSAPEHQAREEGGDR